MKRVHADSACTTTAVAGMINAPNNHAVPSVHRVGVRVTPERPAVGAGLPCGHQESPYAVLRPDEPAPPPLRLFHDDCHPIYRPNCMCQKSDVFPY